MIGDRGLMATARTLDRPCVDCLDPSPAAARHGPAVPRRVAFWLVASVLAALMLGTTLPTPLYVVYQAQWHFSAAIVTVTFAVYAAAVMATLLLAGRSSDEAGRKPVLAVALGASARNVLLLIVRQGIFPALLGLAVGISGALALTRVLVNQLYEVKATDPLTFLCVTAILLLVALAACCLPARRAARIDPMVALRCE